MTLMDGLDSLIESKPKRQRGRPRKKPVRIMSSNVGDDIIARLIAEVRREEQSKDHQSKDHQSKDQQSKN